MRIDAQAKLGGISLTKIRALFRRAGLDSVVSLDFVRDELKLSTLKADRLVLALVKAGFLKEEADQWHLTEAGIRLRAATAAKPLYRNTAKRLLEDLLKRIDALNKDVYFLASVEKAVVFGSYLGDKDRLGDVDVAVQLVRREPDLEKHREANDRRVSKEIERGRHFSNFVEQLYWWNQEAMLFLRNRKRGLSLHEYESAWSILKSAPHRVIFQRREELSRN
jgi:predicted nucleotidyltransferase